MIAHHIKLSKRAEAPMPHCTDGAGLVRWAGISLCLFAGLLTASLFYVPQSFTSKLSLSFASSTGGGTNGLLASIGGAGASPATKYIGVIRSRSFAESVLQTVDVQTLCNLRSREDALEALQEGLMVLDNPRDGLLYISVTLDGPARLAPGAEGRRMRIKQGAARAANLYGDLLREYLVHSDMDSDAILLQGADQRIRQARKQYEAAVSRLTDYVRVHGRAGNFPAGSGGGNPVQGSMGSVVPGSVGGKRADSEESARELQSLYMTRALLEQDIASLDTSQRLSERMQTTQLAQVDALPSEDPLLMEARAAVNTARRALDNDRVLMGPEHPKVVAEREKLHLAEVYLQRQMRGVREGVTSQRVEAQVKRGALQSRYATLTGQIAAIERKAQQGQEFSMELEQRRNEIMLQLEALKATSSQAAILSLQVVSAQNRIKIVDVAQPARAGSPGAGKLAFLCLLLTTVCVAAGLYAEQQITRRSRKAPQLALTNSGS